MIGPLHPRFTEIRSVFTFLTVQNYTAGPSNPTPRPSAARRPAPALCPPTILTYVGSYTSLPYTRHCRILYYALGR
jgi:hypothetical protein